MPYSSIIHCNKSGHRKYIKRIAKSLNLQVKVPYYNRRGLLIKGSSKSHDAFISLFENNTDISIFHDHNHPKTLKNAFKSHCHIGSCQETISIEITARDVVRPMVEYGRTATWYANYYNFPKTDTTPVIAIISLGGNYQLSDLQHYWSVICGLTTYPTVINVAIGQSSIPNFTGEGPDMENTLDLEIAGGACPHAKLLFISAPNTFLGFYQAFSAAINGVTVDGVKYNPSIISCSWGAPEPTFGTANLNTYNDLFNQAASKSITILTASGDNGSTDGYTNNNLPNADFPSASPWVLAIGGTTVTSSTETVWSWNDTNKWGTGSGCSAYFNQQSWQNGLVILPTGTNPSVSYLSGKRALPDVSLSADPSNGYTIYMNGQLYIDRIGGTSAAAPLMAALFGLMNLKYPTAAAVDLYAIFKNSSQQNQCYKDITIGSNDNLPNSDLIWAAGNGFDLCSGMGSVNGTNLFEALKDRGLKFN